MVLNSKLVMERRKDLYIPSEPRFGDQYLHCSGIDFYLKPIF